MVILFDRYNLPKSVYQIIFSTPQQAMVAELLVKEMKAQNGSLNRQMMSLFSTKLHEGRMAVVAKDNPFEGMDDVDFKPGKVKVSYNKKQFYDRILTPMRTMGLINFDMYKKVYTLTDDFERILITIAHLWKKELEKKHSGTGSPD